MTTDEWRPKITFDCTEEQFNKLQQLIPWVMKGKLFSIIIESLIEIIEIGGGMALGAILDKRISILEVLEMSRKRKEQEHETK